MTALRKVELRRADHTDGDALFKWRSDPETEKWSIGQTPTYEAHVKWLKGALENSRVELYIGVCDLTPIGTIRFDDMVSTDGDKTFVSVTVAPEMRGRGMGKLLLEAGCLLKKGVQLYAYIHEKNEKSVKIFTHCGFAEIPAGNVKEFCLYGRGPLLL